MANKRLIVVFISILTLSIVNVVPSDGFEVSAALDIIKIAKEVVLGIAKAWSLIDENVDISEIPFPLLDRTQKQLFTRMAIINNKLDEMSTLVDSVGTNTILAVLQNLPQHMRFELRLNTLLDYLTRLNVFYLNMNNYVAHRDEFARLTMEDFATNVVSTSPSSVISLVERIHAFVSPQETGITNTGILHLLLVDCRRSGGDNRVEHLSLVFKSLLSLENEKKHFFVLFRKFKDPSRNWRDKQFLPRRKMYQMIANNLYNLLPIKREFF